MGDIQEPYLTSTEQGPPESNPIPSRIGAERWAIAEKETQKIICQFQPTVVSDKRRRDVIDYVRRLITNCVGCEVFPYGSVPLKTYLPDGDIDLTAFGGANVEVALAEIVSELQREEKSSGAEFVVKEIQLIHAEVKLVKCLVQNIVVDISFNQIGGLSTLCFLEQVDHLIGKDHLFKRSIILIKAWCYYESRILGAHHGLISTYALETLVLYIFHVFHSTLDGPLAVLYRFLDYFSKFDWENYSISLPGPVHVSSLSEIEAETLGNGGDDLLLTEDFYRYCVDTFSVPSKVGDFNSRTFPQKHLNIVDPLKEYNNLGRSVSKGNFYRIRSAFSYGARKLGQILMRPEDSIAVELRTFFSNTLDRHGSGQRPDVQDPVPVSSPSAIRPAFSVSETKYSRVEKVSSSSKSVHCIGTDGEYKHNPEGSLQDEVYIITALETEMEFRSRTANGQQRGSVDFLRSTMLPDADGSVKGRDAMGYHFSGDAEGHAIHRIQGLKIANDLPNISSPSSEESDSPVAKPHHAPHLYFSNPASGNVKTKNSSLIQSENQETRVFSEVLQAPDEDKGVTIGYDMGREVLSPLGSEDVPSVAYPVTLSEDSHTFNLGCASASDVGCPESLNPLLDLNGDFNIHFNCLQYGRWCIEYASSMPTLSMPPPPPYQFQNMNSWDAIQLSSLRNGFYNGSVNGVIHSPMFYPINPMFVPGVSFAFEEMPKPRGTGTYIPNMNRPPQGYRPSAVKGRNQVPAWSPRSNGQAFTFTEFPVDQGGWVPGSSDVQHSGSPRRKVHPLVNGSILQPNGVVEPGLVQHIPAGTPSLERSTSTQPRPASSLPQTSSQTLITSGMQRPKAVVGMGQDRSIPSFYHLKDKDDFPPLSS